MDALETLLRPVARLLNGSIAESTPARELCHRLAGRVVAVRVRNTALAMYFTIDAAGVTLSGDAVDEPDVVVTGSLVTLARMAGGSTGDLMQAGGIELTGDAETAQDFQKLLAFARPDAEEALSSVVGDTVAHRVGEMTRGFLRWGRDTRRTMRDNLREYLVEESRDVPGRDEVARLADDVYALRDDVERLAARLGRLTGLR